MPNSVDLAEYFRARGFGPADLSVTEMRRLSGGFSRATWMVCTRSKLWGDRTLVARQQLPSGIVQGIAADLKQEYPLLRVLRSQGLPVPEPLLLATDRNPLGSDFILMEKLPGRAVGNATGSSEIADESLLRSIAIVLARLHSIDWTAHHAALRGSKTWRPKTTVSIQKLTTDLLARWEAFARTNIGMTSPSVDAGFAWLRANVPTRDLRPSIVHGDVTFANMLEHDGVLTALLDWEVAGLGDPAKDVAHIKPVIERRMSWSKFMSWYADAGGPTVEPSTLKFYEVLKAVTHTAVTYVARGRRFSDNPATRPDLTEIGLDQPPVYLQEMLRALDD